jgi:hypothetical protein
MAGKKWDSGKPRFGLISPMAERERAGVLTYGAVVYGDHNWRELDDLRARYLDALGRHVSAIRLGARFDLQSSMHHLAHAGTCCDFLLEHDLERNGEANFMERLNAGLAAARELRRKLDGDGHQG